MQASKFFLLFVFLVFIPLKSQCSEGKWINPITDICWECIFPMTISGVEVASDSKEKKRGKKGEPFCFCKGLPPKGGIPISFWEPTVLVDVTLHPYKFLGLGGLSIGKETIKNKGSIGIIADGPSQSSFYHVHWYYWPFLAWLGILTDFACVSDGDLSIGYISELDPFWNDDQLSFLINSEAVLFANPLAQFACTADCVSTSFEKSIDELFWCAGCQGSLYPLTGTVAHHQGAIQASSLLVHRIIAKLHRFGALMGHEDGDFCESKYMPIIKKSMYRTQLVYPVAQTEPPCNTLGRTNLLWGAGKTFPYKGENFVYLIWTKNQCCLDVLRFALGS